MRASSFTSALAAAALATGLLSSAADANGRRGSLKDDYVEARPVFTWTGFYIGAHVGYGWNDQDWQYSGVLVSTDHDGDGFFGGGQIGYNWQRGAIVFGVEADASLAAIDGSTSCPNPAFACSHDINWMATIRGRLGTTVFSPMTLVYGTAGWGWADIDYSALPLVGGGTFSKTHSGFVVGGGIEHAVTANTSVKLEYMAYLLDDVTTGPGALAGGGVSTTDLEPTLHTVKLGVNFRF
jgi:outer membrane immunogenic protein